MRELLELQTGQVAFLSGLLAGFAMTAALNIVRTRMKTGISNFVFLTATVSSLLFIVALYVDVRLTIELAGHDALSPELTKHVADVRVIGTTSATIALLMFVMSVGMLGWLISRSIGVITSILTLIVLGMLSFTWLQMNAIGPMLG